MLCSQVDELKTELSLEKLNYTKLKSESEREAANHKHEAQKLTREINTMNTSLDSFRTQKSELSKDVEVSKVRLAELQARLSEAQTEITSHKEKEKVCFSYHLSLPTLCIQNHFHRLIFDRRMSCCNHY